MFRFTSTHTDAMTGAKFDRIYDGRMDGVVWHTHQAPVLEFRQRTELRMPVFCKDVIKWNEGEKAYKTVKNYACCSEKMFFQYILSLQPHQRCFYEFIHEEDVARMVVDVDLRPEDVHKDSPFPDIRKAIDLFFSYVDKAIAKIHEVTQEDVWGFSMKDAEIVELVSDTDTKISLHLIVHFPGLRMFADFHHHCKALMDLAMDLADKDYPLRANNPMYYRSSKEKYTEPQCIIDRKVNTRNRPMRLIGCAKHKAYNDPSHLFGNPRPDEVVGHLWPSKDHPGKSCREADCVHIRTNTFTEEEYLKTKVCFIPRNASGVPMMPQLLYVPDSLVIDPKLRTNVSTGSASLSAFSVASNNNSNASSPVSGIFMTRGGQSAGGDLDEVASRLEMRIFDFIFRELARETERRCYFGKRVGLGMAIVNADDRRCACHKHFNPTRDGHRSQHIRYIIKIQYPTPVVMVSCMDEDCVAKMTRHGDKPPEFERPIHQLDKNFVWFIEKDIRAFMDMLPISFSALQMGLDQ